MQPRPLVAFCPLTGRYLLHTPLHRPAAPGFQHGRLNGIEAKMTPVKRLLSLGVLWAAVAASAHAQEAPAALSLDRSGEAATFLLQPSGTETVFIPDCRGVVWELLDASAGVYRVLPGSACGPAAPPVPLPAEGRRITPPTPPSYPAALRVIAVVGTGCRTDRPFEVADCRQVTTLTSASITLQAPRP